jgi:hypothetical protein
MSPDTRDFTTGPYVEGPTFYLRPEDLTCLERCNALVASGGQTLVSCEDGCGVRATTTATNGASVPILPEMPVGASAGLPQWVLIVGAAAVAYFLFRGGK